MEKRVLTTVLSFLLCLSSWSATYRTISSVEAVVVETPVGHAPRLPYRLWVRYADGGGEYRQVKWLNASVADEQAEANPEIHPIGNKYNVQGFILGDNTTANGYPVLAEVKVGARSQEQGARGKEQGARSMRAETLPLDQVSIDGNNRLTHNRDLDIDQLVSLPVKQQLHNYRDTYGLLTDGYPESDGWDSPTTKLKGHGSGHYMSAMAMAFACCQDARKKAILRQNIIEMVNCLRACQERTFVWNAQLGRYWEARDFAPEDELREMQGTWADFDRYKQDCQKYGYGYLNAIPAQHCVLIEKYAPYNNESGVWAPYYSVHKQLAGLIDIATYIDDKATAEKALLIAKDMGLWVWNRLHYRTFVKSDGSQDERRAKPGNRYEMWNMYIVGSVNPRHYQTTYHYAVGLDASKPWGNETPHVTCCGGTGAENHVKYQEAAYFVSSPNTKNQTPTIWVALYLPTTAHWKQQGVTIRQECQWPAERSVIRIEKSPSSLLPAPSSKFSMKLRVPYWATEGFDIKLNGKSIAKHYQPSSYVEIPARRWTEKDVVEVVMPFTRHIDFAPDQHEGHWVGAFMRGPLVMAATGITSWEEATVDADHDLSGFIPDYDGDQHLTHYFRINP